MFRAKIVDILVAGIVAAVIGIVGNQFYGILGAIGIAVSVLLIELLAIELTTPGQLNR